MSKHHGIGQLTLPHFHWQIRSDTGIAFNKKPEMKAKEIAETGVEALKSGQYHQVLPSVAGYAGGQPLSGGS
jgi:Metalloenzyme superfamily